MEVTANNNNDNNMGLELPVNTVGGLWDAVLAPAWLLAAPRRRN